MKIHHASDLFETNEFIDQMYDKIKKNGMLNNKFETTFNIIQEKLDSGEFEIEKEDSYETFEKKCDEIARGIQLSLYETIVQTKNIKDDHSHIVSINKKDNMNPRIRAQMMLSCLPGISEKAAKAILERYGSVPGLFSAYRVAENIETKKRMLADVEMVNYNILPLIDIIY
jgi:ERCC4-type nuclease